MSCLLTLKARGYRLTPQRRAILEVLHHEGQHLTADDILKRVIRRSPGINRSTVYRTLEFLEAQDLVVKSELGGREVYHHAEEGHHHHLLCRKCGNIIECSEDLLAPVAISLKKQYGFTPELHHLLIHGICQACAG